MSQFHVRLTYKVTVEAADEDAAYFAAIEKVGDSPDCPADSVVLKATKKPEGGAE